MRPAGILGTIQLSNSRVLNLEKSIL